MRAKKSQPGFGHVTAVVLKGTRRAWTVHEDSLAWKDPGWVAAPGVEEELTGAFVRLCPPAGTPDSEVERVRAAVVKAGALAFQLRPTPKEQPLVEEARRPAASRESLREAAMSVARGMLSRDQVALEKLVEETLSKVGL